MTERLQQQATRLSLHHKYRERVTSAPMECAAPAALMQARRRSDFVTEEQNWRMTLDVGGERIPRTLREIIGPVYPWPITA
jgi:hypothetical protein